MKEELDVSEVLDAVERVQRGYRKPLPGNDHQPKDKQSDTDNQPIEQDDRTGYLDMGEHCAWKSPRQR